jgi:ribosome-binding factor A
MSTYRDERLISLFREEMNKIVERYLETPVGSLVTLTQIDISNGGANARVGVSVIPQKMEAGVIKNLNGFANELHFKLVRAMNIRTVPMPEFYVDPGAENAAKLEKIVMEHKEEFKDSEKPNKKN